MGFAVVLTAHFFVIVQDWFQKTEDDLLKMGLIWTWGTLRIELLQWASLVKVKKVSLCPRHVLDLFSCFYAVKFKSSHFGYCFCTSFKKDD